MIKRYTVDILDNVRKRGKNFDTYKEAISWIAEQQQKSSLKEILVKEWDFHKQDFVLKNYKKLN